MIEALLQIMGLAVALLSGVFGWQGVALIVVIMLAAMFLATLLVAGVERLAGNIADAIARTRGVG